jgi:hypothetical protein
MEKVLCDMYKNWRGGGSSSQSQSQITVQNSLLLSPKINISVLAIPWFNLALVILGYIYLLFLYIYLHRKADSLEVCSGLVNIWIL